MKLRERKPSTSTQDAAAKLLGLEPRNSDELGRLGQVVHWQYGATLGAVRGLMAAASLREPLASLLFFALVWGIDLGVVPTLTDGEPATEWGADELAIDAFHHVVFVGVTALARAFCSRSTGVEASADFASDSALTTHPATLAFGHPAPNPKLLTIGDREGEAFVSHFAGATNRLSFARRCSPLRKKQVRIGTAAVGVVLP